MMWWGNTGWGWGWLAMSLGTIALWALVVWGIVAVVRGFTTRPTGRTTAEDILSVRFARGEIDADEYARRLDTLRTGRAA